jgi:hypothetical protein
MSSSSPRLLRYRLVESIVPLAAGGDEFARHAHASHPRDTIDELVANFVDWMHGFVPGLLDDDYLTTSLAGLRDQLAAAALSALRVGDTRECDEAVHDPEWSEVRRLARQALEEFRALGVTIPDLGTHLLRGVETVPASEREPSDLIH